MGATVSTIAASLFGVRPRGLFLIEPIFLPEEFYSLTPSVEGHPLASKSIKRLNYWQSEQDAHAYLKSRSFFTTWDEEILHLYKRFGMEKMPEGDMRLACSPESEAAMFMGGWCCNPWPLLERSAVRRSCSKGRRAGVDFVDLHRAVAPAAREFGLWRAPVI